MITDDVNSRLDDSSRQRHPQLAASGSDPCIKLSHVIHAQVGSLRPAVNRSSQTAQTYRTKLTIFTTKHPAQAYDNGAESKVRGTEACSRFEASSNSHIGALSRLCVPVIYPVQCSYCSRADVQLGSPRRCSHNCTPTSCLQLNRTTPAASN